MTDDGFRQGTIVRPQVRLDLHQVDVLHRASLAILEDPGITSFNETSVDLLGGAGCDVSRSETEDGAWQIRFPEAVVRQALESAPGRVVLGARDPANRLVLDTDVPRVYFGTGSETNITLRSSLAEFARADDPGDRRTLPVYTPERGTLKGLCRSAKLCNALPNVDFFIRNVNVQDEDITYQNKDLNVFLASLSQMTKHVQAGLANLDRLDDVLALAARIAGGKEALADNPVISFITCLVKSPLQMVADTTQKLIEISRRGLPVVISSSPQGGSTAPITEEGMVAMINAEILAGITLAQVVNPGTPVLYGAVPVRARLDTLHDLYGAPEFIHYNADCVQMAKRYGVPVYSTAGVGDGRVPGLQTSVEKLFSQLAVPASGAHYVHYAFGLLDKTNIFCPLQAVLDDAHVSMVKDILRPADFSDDRAGAAVKEVRKVMTSATRLFARHIRKARREGRVSAPYPFESDSAQDEVLIRAQRRLDEILSGPGDELDREVMAALAAEIEGVFPPERFELP